MPALPLPHLILILALLMTAGFARAEKNEAEETVVKFYDALHKLSGDEARVAAGRTFFESLKTSELRIEAVELVDKPRNFSGFVTIHNIFPAEFANEMLAKLLKDEDARVRRRAAIGVGTLGSGDLHADALRELLKEKDTASKVAAVRGMSSSTSQLFIPDLRGLMSDKDKTVREYAVLNLKKRVYPQDRQDFLAGLKDESSTVRGVSVEALAIRANDDDLPIIKTMLEDADEMVRRATVVVIADWADYGGRARAIAAKLTDESETVRYTAIEKLRQMQAKAHAAEVGKRLEDPYFMARVAAIKWIHDLGDEAQVKQLNTLLSDEHPQVRTAAAEALADKGGQADSSKIAQLLGDDDLTVRLAAIRALRGLRAQGEMPSVLKALDDSYPPVCIEAYKFIGQYAGKDVIPDLQQRHDRETNPFKKTGLRNAILEITQRQL